MAFAPTNPICFHKSHHSLTSHHIRRIHPPPTRRLYHTTTTTTTTASQTNTTNPSPTPPPSTFYQAIKQAQTSVQAALHDGHTLIEVEFPPLPTDQLSSTTVGAYEVSDANLRLAIDFSTKFADGGKSVVLAFPDLAEKDRAVEQNGESEFPADNIRFGSLRDARKGSFIERLWTMPDIDVAVRENDDIFVVLGASCQELPDVERLVEAVDGRPVILFNLTLDAARGDLGVPAFPRALYRAYPGPYQVLLDTPAGNYQRLCVMEERPPLGVVRDILTDAVNIEGVSGKRDSLLFKGYRSVTWWEQDTNQAVSNNWRS